MRQIKIRYPDGGAFRTSGRQLVRLSLMEAMNARDIPNGDGVVYNEATPIYWRIALLRYGVCANILALRVQSVNVISCIHLDVPTYQRVLQRNSHLCVLYSL